MHSSAGTSAGRADVTRYSKVSPRDRGQQVPQEDKSKPDSAIDKVKVSPKKMGNTTEDTKAGGPCWSCWTINITLLRIYKWLFCITLFMSIYVVSMYIFHQ